MAVLEGVTASPAPPAAPSSPGGATVPPEPTGAHGQGCDREHQGLMPRG